MLKFIKYVRPQEKHRKFSFMDEGNEMKQNKPKGRIRRSLRVHDKGGWVI